MYRIDDDLEVRFSTKKLPLEYKLLENNRFKNI